MAPSSVLASDDVAFILGPARSGTTLLYKALCLHPDAAYISNWVARFPRIPQLACLDRVARRMPDAQRRVWFSDGTNAYVYGQERPVRDRAFPMPVEGEPVFTLAGVSRPAGPEPRAVDPVVAMSAAFRAIRRYGGGSRLISKRIANNLRVGLLNDAFPSARYVNLVRDGRPVALSLSKVDWWPDNHVWWYGGTPKDWEAEGRDPFELCARNWLEEVREIRSGLEAVAAERTMSLRYEDLLEDPIAMLQEVASFIGLGPSPRWREVLGTISFGRRGDSWRRDLTPEAIETITSIQHEELEAHGYTP